MVEELTDGLVGVCESVGSEVGLLLSDRDSSCCDGGGPVVVMVWEGEGYASDGEALVESVDDRAGGGPAECLCGERFLVEIVRDEDGVGEIGEGGIVDGEDGTGAVGVGKRVEDVRGDVCDDWEGIEGMDVVVEPVCVFEAAEDGEFVVGAGDHAIGEAIEPFGDEGDEEFLG